MPNVKQRQELGRTLHRWPAYTPIAGIPIPHAGGGDCGGNGTGCGGGGEGGQRSERGTSEEREKGEKERELREIMAMIIEVADHAFLKARSVAEIGLFTMDGPSSSHGRRRTIHRPKQHDRL